MGITASVPEAPADASLLVSAAGRGDMRTVAALLAQVSDFEDAEGACQRAAAAAAGGGHLGVIRLLHERGLLVVTAQEALALGSQAIRRGDEAALDWLDSVVGEDWLSTPLTESDFKRLLAEPLLACPPRSPVLSRVLARLGRERLSGLQGWILVESACTRPRVSAVRVRTLLAAGCPLSLGRHSLITTLCVAISSAASASSDGSSGDEGCTALRGVLCAIVRSAAGRSALTNPACAETHGWLANHLPGLGDPADLLPLLVDAGLDINLADADGQTAAHWAVLALQGHGGTRFALAPRLARASAHSVSKDDALVLPRAQRLLRFIASRDGDLGHADAEGHTPLSRALALYCSAQEPGHRSEADALVTELLKLSAPPLSAGGALRPVDGAPESGIAMASRPPPPAAAALLQSGICAAAWRRRRHAVIARAVRLDPDRFELRDSSVASPADSAGAATGAITATGPFSSARSGHHSVGDDAPSAASCFVQ